MKKLYFYFSVYKLKYKFLTFKMKKISILNKVKSSYNIEIYNICFQKDF